MKTYDVFLSIEGTGVCLRYDGKHQYRDAKNYFRALVKPDDTGELIVTECTNQGFIGRKVIPDDGTRWVEA